MGPQRLRSLWALLLGPALTNGLGGRHPRVLQAPLRDLALLPSESSAFELLGFFFLLFLTRLQVLLLQCSAYPCACPTHPSWFLGLSRSLASRLASSECLIGKLYGLVVFWHLQLYSCHLQRFSRLSAHLMHPTDFQDRSSRLCRASHLQRQVSTQTIAVVEAFVWPSDSSIRLSGGAFEFARSHLRDIHFVV